MDHIDKALKKLSAKEQARIREILLLLQSLETESLDVKKLKGRDDIFRIRTGALRIIYRVEQKQIFILSIERRSDTTYNF